MGDNQTNSQLADNQRYGHQHEKKSGIPEGIHREVYDKLEVDYQHLPVRRNLV